MSPNQLAFTMDDPGEWTAVSAIGHDGVNFIWRIVVMEDGTFDVNDSDSELRTSRHPVKSFARLDLAKKHCQDSENEICADAAYWNSIDEAHYDATPPLHRHPRKTFPPLRPNHVAAISGGNGTKAKRPAVMLHGCSRSSNCTANGQ